MLGEGVLVDPPWPLGTAVARLAWMIARQFGKAVRKGVAIRNSMWWISYFDSPSFFSNLVGGSNKPSWPLSGTNGNRFGLESTHPTGPPNHLLRLL
jgi:hypothetical protein